MGKGYRRGGYQGFEVYPTKLPNCDWYYPIPLAECSVTSGRRGSVDSPTRKSPVRSSLFLLILKLFFKSIYFDPCWRHFDGLRNYIYTQSLYLSSSCEACSNDIRSTHTMALLVDYYRSSSCNPVILVSIFSRFVP